MPSDGDEEEDEDEETLQLRLEQIQAKLKLKKLQAKKAKGDGGAGHEGSSRTSSRADSVTTSPRKSLRPAASQPDLRRAAVEIPLSPTRERRPTKEPTSPARVRLGLDGLRAQDVSLKRARDGTQLTRSSSQTAPSMSFSAKLLFAKEQEQEQRAKDERIQQSRSKGFGVGAGGSSFADATRPGAASQARARERKDLSPIRQPSHRKQQDHTQHRDGSTIPGRSSARSTYSDRPVQASRAPVAPQSSLRARSPHKQDTASTYDDRPRSSHGEKPQEEASSSFEAYSSTHLAKRHIAHIDLTRAIDRKEIYTLPRLLKEIKAPLYEPPDCENDFVVFGILASKSTPYNQKPQHRTTDEDKPQEDAEKPRNKFMVLKLCDLKWEVDCFLFGTAFDQFWKLTPGTLLAILNPNIMPPKTNQHSGKFCLKLGSSEDCVMEVGTARDLGYCVSVKKNGEQCGTWVDKRKTEVCEFHVNLLVEKSRASRMEVNTMWRGHGGGGGDGPKSRISRTGMFGPAKRGKDGLRPANGSSYDREYGQIYSVPSGHARSAATLLDDDDTDALHGMTRAEASRKRIAEHQKERDTARRLAQLGNGAGAEYLRVKHGSAAHDAEMASAEAKGMFDKPSAAELGLLANKASDAHLGPAKDGRKRAFGAAAMSARGPEAMGWSGAAKWGLLQPKSAMSPERGQKKLDCNPKKRARLLLEGKGVRTPGRESLGEELKRVEAEEDDDLDIV